MEVMGYRCSALAENTYNTYILLPYTRPHVGNIAKRGEREAGTRRNPTLPSSRAINS